jgi:hypothetical protein
MVREYIEIKPPDSLETLIERLAEVKASIPPDARPEQVSLRGDDVFGRHILVTYLRPERPEELAVPVRARKFAAAWRRGVNKAPRRTPSRTGRSAR